MIIDFFSNAIKDLTIFDFVVFLVFFYCVIQCFLKGFSLSLISFMKWIVSTIVTIILVPKLRPIVSNYIESDFINNFGLGISIFFITLFLIIVIPKWIRYLNTLRIYKALDNPIDILKTSLILIQMLLIVWYYEYVYTY